MTTDIKMDQRIDEIRTQLNELQASVANRKRRVEKDINRESGPIPADFSEQATAVENDETLIAIQAEMTLQLAQIKHALKRLESGDYGSCEVCNEQISGARLEAMPAATVCVQCALAQS